MILAELYQACKHTLGTSIEPTLPMSAGHVWRIGALCPDCWLIVYKRVGIV